MRNTIVMLTAIGSFVLTWLTVAYFSYCLSDDMSFKEIMRSPGITAFMLIIGWLPSIIISADVYERKHNKGEC